jgi:hypothetical protein
MFSLIIVLVSIVLVAGLALATMYYGGTSFLQGSEKAAVSRYLNEGAQVSGAIKVFRAEKGYVPQELDELVQEDYLKALPEGADGTDQSFQNADGYIFAGVPSQTVCEALNERLNYHGPVPSCTDPAIEGRDVCCSN